LLRQRKKAKKGDPDVAPFASLRAHTEAGHALAGKKELALLAFGQRCSNSFFSFSASAHPPSARHTEDRTNGSLRFAHRGGFAASRQSTPGWR
jgi:hypothetical protein